MHICPDPHQTSLSPLSHSATMDRCLRAPGLHGALHELVPVKTRLQESTSSVSYPDKRQNVELAPVDIGMISLSH